MTAALKKAIPVPFSEDPDFSRRMADTTRQFSLEITGTLNHFWDQKASPLRNEVMAIKDRIYTGSVKLDKKRCTHYILVCEIWIMPFAEKREKWLKHVNGNSISLEKRPLDTRNLQQAKENVYGQ